MSLLAEQFNESELAQVSICSGMDGPSLSCCLCKALKQHKAKLGVPPSTNAEWSPAPGLQPVASPMGFPQGPGLWGCMADKGLQALIRAASACTVAPDKGSRLKRWTPVCCGTQCPEYGQAAASAPKTRPRAFNSKAMLCCCCTSKKAMAVAGGWLVALFFVILFLLSGY